MEVSLAPGGDCMHTQHASSTFHGNPSLQKWRSLLPFIPVPEVFLTHSADFPQDTFFDYFRPGPQVIEWNSLTANPGLMPVLKSDAQFPT